LTCREYGHPESSLSREGAKYGIDEFVKLKYLCFGGINA
jgi:succinate-semialdehyde dehydrogenase/glutarate-semialdehyde dehydrogenase